LLELFLKLPFWTALAEGRVIASAVGALWFTCAITAGVANLTTRGAGFPSSACIFAVNKFLTFKAAQWVFIQRSGLGMYGDTATLRYPM